MRGAGLDLGVFPALKGGKSPMKVRESGSKVFIRDAFKRIFGCGGSAFSEVTRAAHGGLKERFLPVINGRQRADQRVDDGGTTVQLAHDVVFMEIPNAPRLAIEPKNPDLSANGALGNNGMNFFSGAFPVCCKTQ